MNSVISDQFSCLYVEDDELNRLVVQILMEETMGVKLLTIFEDSSNFMERVKAMLQLPDVILLDIDVRPLDGFEMLNLLRADPMFDESKMIAVTASVTNEEIEKLRGAGFDGGIGKPLRMETFPGLIAQIHKGETVWHVV